MFSLTKKKSNIGATHQLNEIFLDLRKDKTTQTFGEISVVQNRFCWKIPRFHRFRYNPDLVIYSPEIFIGGRYCHLFARPYVKYSQESQSKFLIGACAGSSRQYHSNCYQNKGLKVRLGIIGKSAEFSLLDVEYGIYNMKQRTLFHRSEFEVDKDQWVPEGNLHLFMALEYTDVKPVLITPSETDTEIGVKQLQEDFKNIFQNGNVSDVILRVDGQEFKSHRCILSARSPVFMAMMTHDTKENNTGAVDIQDVDHGTFSTFLEYLYTGNLRGVAPENAGKLYKVADKYQVFELKKSCMDYILKNISVDNFCELLTLSVLHEEKELTDACTKFFIKNPLAIVQTPTWKTFLSENPLVGNELYMKQLETHK